MELIDFMNPDLLIEDIIKSDWFNLLSIPEQDSYLDRLHFCFLKLDDDIRKNYKDSFESHAKKVDRLKKIIRDSEDLLMIDKFVSGVVTKKNIDALLIEKESNF